MARIQLGIRSEIPSGIPSGRFRAAACLIRVHSLIRRFKRCPGIAAATYGMHAESDIQADIFALSFEWVIGDRFH